MCVIGEALPERLAEVETGGELVPFDNAGLVAAFRDTLVHPHGLITDASHEAIEDGRARRFGSHTCSSPRSGQAGRPQSQDMSGGGCEWERTWRVECLLAIRSRMGGKDQRGGLELMSFAMRWWTRSASIRRAVVACSVALNRQDEGFEHGDRRRTVCSSGLPHRSRASGGADSGPGHVARFSPILLR